MNIVDENVQLLSLFHHNPSTSLLTIFFLSIFFWASHRLRHNKLFLRVNQVFFSFKFLLLRKLYLISSLTTIFVFIQLISIFPSHSIIFISSLTKKENKKTLEMRISFILRNNLIISFSMSHHFFRKRFQFKYSFFFCVEKSKAMNRNEAHHFAHKWMNETHTYIHLFTYLIYFLSSCFPHKLRCIFIISSNFICFCANSLT